MALLEHMENKIQNLQLDMSASRNGKLDGPIKRPSRPFTSPLHFGDVRGPNCRSVPASPSINRRSQLHICRPNALSMDSATVINGCYSPRRNTNHPSRVDARIQNLMSRTGELNIRGKIYKFTDSDLERVCVLGSGSCGTVHRMRHIPSGETFAVKQMGRSADLHESKQILSDLDVVLRLTDNGYIVRCLGALITEQVVYVCMEEMATCLERLARKLKPKTFPEPVLGKIAVSTVHALDYLKRAYDIIHRDIKPSNILVSWNGEFKLCDFGIAGRLIQSKVRTRNAGCVAYMAPERIDCEQSGDYGVRADVWSLGVTLVELAIGHHPYLQPNNSKTTDFEVLARILHYPAPTLGSNFSPLLQSFVKDCLIKDSTMRPKYDSLLVHRFILKHEKGAEADFNVKHWVRSLLSHDYSQHLSNS